jgi:hypothetical protein
MVPVIMISLCGGDADRFMGMRRVIMEPPMMRETAGGQKKCAEYPDYALSS